LIPLRLVARSLNGLLLGYNARMRQRKSFFGWLTGWLLLSLLGVGILSGTSLSVRAAPNKQAGFRDVIVNEIAWGGTIASSETDEWIELYNTTSTPIDFNGEWLLISQEQPILH